MFNSKGTCEKWENNNIPSDEEPALQMQHRTCNVTTLITWFSFVNKDCK